ncbi:MAG: class I SAM-dependent methyltransferase [Bacteroidota bacterium]
MATASIQWFENWFDSPYYHILYKHRDHKEAELFIDKLIGLLKPEKDSRFLDLACGKGRHSIYLNKKGFDVTGIDLSRQSITHASQCENEKLHFFVHDMRKPFRINYFNYVLNLFTSFGYFDNERDDIATIDSIYKALQPNGIFVLDFLNIQKAVRDIVPEELHIVDDITFNIRKKTENDFIVKDIQFSDKGNNYHFQERLKMITLDDLEKYFSAKKLKVLHLLGNYELEKFNEGKSERLIIIAQKN